MNSQINQALVTLENFGATVVPCPNGTKVLYVNGVKVLLRNQNAPATNIVIELFHEANQSVWVKSWGLTSDAVWLLSVSYDGHHRWFHLDQLRKYITDMVTKGDMQLVNNSLHTRANNGPSSNIMAVWLSPDDAGYVHVPGTRPTYSAFLGCIR